MKLSTRSRYGVRLMVALASTDNNKSLFLKDIAASEDISEKYLSLIVIPLKAAGLIRSIRGSRGGYVLAKSPVDISICDIVEAVEGNTCLVPCVHRPESCPRTASCPTRNIWAQLTKTIRDTMSHVTLAQLTSDKKMPASAIRPAARQDIKNH